MTERAFIDYWKNTDFSSYNESDVREEFIAPLLNILGYSKNTVNDIVREKTLQLTEPFQRLGRKRVQIDYMPTIRLKSFWILEAKPGNIKVMNEGDLLQAYLYATHPEIQAQYIVLCNGWSLQVYDVHQINGWNIPIYRINHANCQDNFVELKNLLAAKTMLESRRKKLLQQIKNTFEVELDINQWNMFVSEFNKMKSPLEFKIKENIRELQRKDFKARQEKKKEILENADVSTLLGWMALSGPRTAELHLEYYKRIEKADIKTREELLRKLMQRYRGRCHAEFKCDCLAILLRIVRNGLEIGSSPYLRNPKMMLAEVIEENLTYHKNNSMQNALDYLDRSCCKFAYLVIKSTLMDPLSDKIDDKKLNMAIEEILVGQITVAKEMVRLINILVDYLWMYLADEKTTQDIWRNIRVLDDLIRKIDTMEIPKYPDGDEDLLNYDLYGDKFDYLFRVSHRILKENIGIVEGLQLNEEVKNIIFAKEETVLRFMPQLPLLENTLSEAELEATIRKVVIALYRTGEAWRDLDT